MAIRPMVTNTKAMAPTVSAKARTRSFTNPRPSSSSYMLDRASMRCFIAAEVLHRARAMPSAMPMPLLDPLADTTSRSWVSRRVLASAGMAPEIESMWR